MNVLGMFNRGRDRHIGFVYGEASFRAGGIGRVCTHLYTYGYFAVTRS
jgi:hypothetical protein